MGSFSFGRYRSRSESTVVKIEFDGAAEMETVKSRIKRLSDVLPSKSDVCCFVLGDGGMPHGTYEEISKTLGADVLFTSSLLPGFLFFLRKVVASDWGLVKLNDCSLLPDIFEKLTQQSMATIFIIPSIFENKFIESVKNKSQHLGFDYGARMSDRHLIYLVDADNSESQSGIAEYFSCGISCDDDLVEAFSSRGFVKRTV